MAAPLAVDLLVLAELNPDVVVQCDGPDVRFGQVEQLVERAALTLGSSGAITASAAAAQGLRVAVCGVVGDDEAGRSVLRMLGERGVGTASVACRAGRSTGMTVVLSTPAGDRALLTFPGTMAELRVTDVPDDLLASARHVHVSSLFLQRGLQPGLAALLATARRGGATTSLDPGWDPAEEWTAALPALAEVDYLLPNAQEATATAAAGGFAATDAAVAAQSLQGAGAGVVVVKDGAAGAVVCGPHGTARVGAPATRVIDTTGAGDNFDGGFLAALLDGDDPVTAARRGVACGSISVQGWGGTGRHAGRAEAIALAADLLVDRPRTPVATKE